MGLRDFEGALRQATKDWSDSRNITWGAESGAPALPEARELRFLFGQQDSQRLTMGSFVRHSGTAVCSILVPAGLGIVALLEDAEALRIHLAQTLIGGGEVLCDASVRKVGRERGKYRVDVLLPWWFDEYVVPRSPVGGMTQTGVDAAYVALLDLWEERVRVPLGLKTFVDNSPPEANTPPPWALLAFATLPPVIVEMQRLVVPGRAIAAVTFPAAGGTGPCTDVCEAIARAFDGAILRGLTFETPVITRVGVTPVGSLQANVRLPFRFEVQT